ncbi:MAG TPA: HemK family protein methyltransferase, partial [Steroidobacteraceae bacterium]|nr:HemK family protein methyltransferase [Steroidobacteraceae bacterium]
MTRRSIAQLSHTTPLAAATVGAATVGAATVGAAIERCARALSAARVHFGHGTDNARDEAAELVFFAAGLAHECGARAYGEPLERGTRVRIERLLRQRIERRVPLAYLTRRAFFAGLELYVDERVLVPRSPIAELIVHRFAPWIRAARVRRVLDVGTGSGAIALACARAFPRARVDAVDISRAALAVARLNVRRLRLKSRVHVMRSDFFAALGRRRY